MRRFSVFLLLAGLVPSFGHAATLAHALSPDTDGASLPSVQAMNTVGTLPVSQPPTAQPVAVPQPPRPDFVSTTDPNLCGRAALAAERGYHIPDQFLVAMGRVESGRHLPNGLYVAWPWTVNAQGKGYMYATRQEAIEAVRTFWEQGIRSIDVGCMQVNLQQHADAFPSLEAAFDPATNASYAARFLVELFARTGSWPRAAAAYHSFTPDIGTAYQWKVLESWALPSGANGPTPLTHAVPRTQPLAHSTQPVVAYATAAGNAAMRQAMTGAPSSASPGAPGIRSFHGGAQGFNPPPSRPAMAEGSGRSLAFYRANPVHLVRQAMVTPTRF